MSPSEILIVILAALLLFGGKRLPELARTWGRTVAEFRKIFLRLKRDIGLDFDFDDNKTYNSKRQEPPQRADQPELPEPKVEQNPKSETQSTDLKEDKTIDKH